jgi:hypothetical protein
VLYNSICNIIPILAGLSAIFGLYATIMFSLTILYGKSTLFVFDQSECKKYRNRPKKCWCLVWFMLDDKTNCPLCLFRSLLYSSSSPSFLQ